MDFDYTQLDSLENVVKDKTEKPTNKTKFLTHLKALPRAKRPTRAPTAPPPDAQTASRKARPSQPSLQEDAAPPGPSQPATDVLIGVSSAPPAEEQPIVAGPAVQPAARRSRMAPAPAQQQQQQQVPAAVPLGMPTPSIEPAAAPQTQHHQIQQALQGAAAAAAGQGHLEPGRRETTALPITRNKPVQKKPSVPKPRGRPRKTDTTERPVRPPEAVTRTEREGIEARGAKEAGPSQPATEPATGRPVRSTRNQRKPHPAPQLADTDASISSDEDQAQDEFTATRKRGTKRTSKAIVEYQPPRASKRQRKPSQRRLPAGGEDDDGINAAYDFGPSLSDMERDDEELDEEAREKQAHEIDVKNMSLREVVAMGMRRERRMQAQEQRTKRQQEEEEQQQDEHNGTAAGTTSIVAVAGTSTVAGTSAAAASAGAGTLTFHRQPAAAADAGRTFAPQVQVIGGEIKINPQSLTVQAQERQEFTRVVTEDTPRLNSMTYSKRLSNERWTVEDTELFYKALSQFGTDFTLIAQLFPGRDRKHLRNKYSKESSKNGSRVDAALRAASSNNAYHFRNLIAEMKRGNQEEPEAEQAPPAVEQEAAADQAEEEGQTGPPGDQ